MDTTTILFFVSSIALLRLAHQDWNNQTLDERISYYMMGLITTLFLLQNQIVFWIILVLVVSIGLPHIKKRLSCFLAAGDITVLTWLTPALILISPFYFAIWLIVYGLTNASFYFIFKSRKQPGIPPIFFSILILWLFYYLTIGKVL